MTTVSVTVYGTEVWECLDAFGFCTIDVFCVTFYFIRMEGTCKPNKKPWFEVFPLNKEESRGICPTNTSLNHAALRGKLSCVKELIAAGADVNTTCKCHDNGALLSAASNGHFDCLPSGTDVNI